MADQGGGATYYIETVDQAGGIFEEELEGLLSLCAQNVRVEIQPGADAQFGKVLHDYPSAADVKYMKQMSYSAHRSRRESRKRFRRGNPTDATDPTEPEER